MDWVLLAIAATIVAGFILFRPRPTERNEKMFVYGKPGRGISVGGRNDREISDRWQAAQSSRLDDDFITPMMIVSMDNTTSGDDNTTYCEPVYEEYRSQDGSANYESDSGRSDSYSSDSGSDSGSSDSGGGGGCD